METGSRGESLMRAWLHFPHFLRFRPTGSERLAYMLHEHQVTAIIQEQDCWSSACQLGSQNVPGYKRGDMTPNVFSRLKRLAPLQTPGSGLWNTLSIKPSAHTSCLPSISQKMGMSCSSLTCPICTKSLRGVKYGHLRTRGVLLFLCTLMR